MRLKQRCDRGFSRLGLGTLPSATLDQRGLATLAPVAQVQA